MHLDRRQFVKLGLATGTALAAANRLGLTASALELKRTGSASPTGRRNAEIPYTCLTCNIEDGGIAYVENGRIRRLEGNPEHPGNRGRLCAKGNSGHLHVYDPYRILHPLKRVGARGAGQWKRISWDEALNEVAAKIAAGLDEDPNTVCFHFGRNRTHGFISRFTDALGTDTVLNHTSICESSKKVAMEHAWGPDIETPDFAHTKYILNFGSNIAEAGYFHNPYIQRISEGIAKSNAKLITFDPRLTNTAAISHEWHPIMPGTDAAVALAMCNVIMQEGLADTEFIRKFTNVTPEQLARHLARYTPELAERESGIPAADIRRIAIEFATAGPATTYTYRGPAKHVNGSYNEKAIMMLNVVTGNIEKRGGYNLPRGLGFGGGPEPHPPKPKHKSVLQNPPEYPLANHHVAHHAAHGIKEGRQKINVYMLYVHDPLYSMPDADTWRSVLADEELIPYFVSFSINMDEATQLADIILPDTTFLERWDPESMPSSVLGWVGLRQPVIETVGNARPFRDVIYDLANRIDKDGKRGIKRYFSYGSADAYVRTQLESTPGLKQAGGFDYLKKHGVFPAYDPAKEEAFQFGAHVAPLSAAELQGTTVKGRTVFKGDKAIGLMVDGKAVQGFGTATRTFQVHVDEWKRFGFEPMPHYEPIKAHKAMQADDLVMITFKVNVHTQSRTSNLKWLQELSHNNPLWINPETAAKRGIKDGDLVRVQSGVGYMVTRARVTEGIHPRVVAVSHSAGRNPRNRGDYGAQPDTDLDKNRWWNEEGVHPNPIYPIATDPIGGSFAWFDPVVRVSKASGSDRYGMVKADPGASRKSYEATLAMTTKVRDKASGGHAQITSPSQHQT